VILIAITQKIVVRTLHQPSNEPLWLGGVFSLS
jgi:hypothetical protein